MSTLFPFFVLAGVVLATSADDIRIGAFNIQVFGRTKAAKPEVMDILAKVIQRYDILLIQEIRDSSGKAIYKLLELVNRVGPEVYNVIVSERLGRTTSKEQYAFMYRNESNVEVLDQYQYHDSKDLFEREPFAVRFSIADSAVGEITLAGIHVDPDEAVQEIDALASVHDTLVAHWNSDNVVIMGDFNADCGYVTNKESEALVLRDPTYKWLIQDGQDTTTKATDCTYDRIIVTGDELLESIIPGSGRVYRYDKDYHLNKTETRLISDHYPVEFQLYREDQAYSSAGYRILAEWLLSVLALIKQI